MSEEREILEEYIGRMEEFFNTVVLMFSGIAMLIGVIGTYIAFLIKPNPITMILPLMFLGLTLWLFVRAAKKYYDLYKEEDTNQI